MQEILRRWCANPFAPISPETDSPLEVAFCNFLSEVPEAIQDAMRKYEGKAILTLPKEYAEEIIGILAASPSLPFEIDRNRLSTLSTPAGKTVNLYFGDQVAAVAFAKSREVKILQLPEFPVRKENLPWYIIEPPRHDLCKQAAHSILECHDYWQTMASEATMENPAFAQFREALEPYLESLERALEKSEGAKRETQLTEEIYQQKMAEQLPKAETFERAVRKERRRRVGRLKALAEAAGVLPKEMLEHWDRMAVAMGRVLDSNVIILPFCTQPDMSQGHTFYPSLPGLRSNIDGFYSGLGFIVRNLHSETLPIENAPYQQFMAGLFLDEKVLNYLSSSQYGIKLIRLMREPFNKAEHDWFHHIIYPTNADRKFSSLTHHKALVFKGDYIQPPFNKALQNSFDNSTTSSVEALSYRANILATERLFEKKPRIKARTLKRIEKFCDYLIELGKELEEIEGSEYAEKVKAYLAINALERALVVFRSGDPDLEGVKDKIEKLGLSTPTNEMLTAYLERIILNPAHFQDEQIQIMSEGDKRYKVNEYLHQITNRDARLITQVPDDYAPSLKALKIYYSLSSDQRTPYDHFQARMIMQSWSNRPAWVHLENGILFTDVIGTTARFIGKTQYLEEALKPELRNFRERMKSVPKERGASPVTL